MANHKGYNSRIRSGMATLVLPGLRAALFFVVILPWVNASSAPASDWRAPESELANKIAAVTGPGAIALEITNRASLERTEFEEISRGLRGALAAQGLQFVHADQAAATVQVFLSENLEGLVWVAEIDQGTNEPTAVMVSTDRRGPAPLGGEPAKLMIHKALIWSQKDIILDVAVIDGTPTHMAVLTANRVDLYRVQDGRWQPEQTLTVAHERPWPRDLRGRLVLRQDHLLDVYMPGVVCRSTATAPLALNCHAGDDPWPLGAEQFGLSAFFTPSRNYFTGALAPGIGKQTSAPVFYSAAAQPRDQYTLWLFAGVDGQVHLLDGMSDQTGGKLGWGSGIASLKNGCTPGWDVLAGGMGSRANDTLQAFELPDREPVAVSPPVEFDGRITALWTESNGSRAVAIVRASGTGEYEAYRLSLNCGE